MAHLVPEKLHVKYLLGMSPGVLATPRYYTLTHSDSTGDLFLSIGPCYDTQQISKLYTRIKRDEVLAELGKEPDCLSLDVFCHVSGGLVIGRAKWRYDIFCSEIPLALEAIRFGDKALFEHNLKLDQVQVLVHFKSSDKRFDKTEKWGTLADYKI